MTLKEALNGTSIVGQELKFYEHGVEFRMAVGEVEENEDKITLHSIWMYRSVCGRSVQSSRNCLELEKDQDVEIHGSRIKASREEGVVYLYPRGIVAPMDSDFMRKRGRF